MSDLTKYSAADSMAGYLYQCRYALFLMLSRLETSPSLRLQLETVDDIVIKDVLDPSQWLQLKHHQPSGGLGDMSPDWWKTIRVWLDIWDPTDPPVNMLVTTAECTDGSAGALLRHEPHDTDKAHDLLATAAAGSRAQGTKDARAAFLALDEAERRQFVDAIVVADSQPTIAELDSRLSAAVIKVAGRVAAPKLLEHLEGWWFGRCVDCLTGVSDSIAMGELEMKLDDLRQQFFDDSLPMSAEIFSGGVEASEFLDRVFVKQLDVIDVGAKRILFAVRDFWRAYTQRSRWLEDGLLYPGELQDYERRLTEAWESRFEAMRDLLGDAAAEDTIRAEARRLYAWAENDADIFIRPRVTEPSMVKGSFHILADDVRVGWHVDFAARVMAALEPVGTE